VKPYGSLGGKEKEKGQNANGKGQRSKGGLLRGKYGFGTPPWPSPWYGRGRLWWLSTVLKIWRLRTSFAEASEVAEGAEHRKICRKSTLKRV